MLISIYRKYLHYFERPCSHGMTKKTWRHERIILCICDQQASFGQIMFSPTNKIFPVRRWLERSVKLRKKTEWITCNARLICLLCQLIQLSFVAGRVETNTQTFATARFFSSCCSRRISVNLMERYTLFRGLKPKLRDSHDSLRIVIAT